MNQFRSDITPVFAPGNVSADRPKDEQSRLEKLLEAIILKTPGGIAKSIGEGIQTGVDVVGSIGQLDKAEQLGRQFRRTLPDIVSAVTEQPGAVASALGRGLEQDVLDKGLGAFIGVEDAVPVVGKAGKLMSGIGAAAMMSKMPKMSKAAQDVVDASKRGKAKDVDMPPAENAKFTALAGDATIGTYKKANNVLSKFIPEGRTLDFGSGAGVTKQELGFDTYEPFFVTGERRIPPDFDSAEQIPDNSYEKVISQNVINTVPAEGREQIYGDIGRILKPGGYAVINSRDWNAVKTPKNQRPGPEERSIIVESPRGDRFQKGYTDDAELLAEARRVLSTDEFEVTTIPNELYKNKEGKLEKLSGVSILVRKKEQPVAPQALMSSGGTRLAGDLLSDPGEATAYTKIPENEPGARISQRFPMGATATEDPLTENLIIDTDVMRSDPKLTGKLVQTISEYPNIQEQVVKRGDADEIIEAMKQNEMSNLRFIFDQMPPEVRDRAMQWYDGANKVANEFGQRYGLSTEQSAGIMAALSPQMDWFKNVTLAERVMDTMKNHQSAANTKEMTEWLDSNFYKPPAKPRSKDWRPAIDSIRGKRLEEIVEPVEKALWLRAFDETTRDRGYRILTPEGDFGDVVKKADRNARAGWGSFADIAKAVKVFDDGSMENISRTMGMQHKVRNFYNNIADPDAIYGDVTMDTHAVAAGLLRPLSGEASEVKHNLGQKVSRSKPKGVQGTYPMHAEAYRELAAQEGMLPRQMQSITWEGVRGMYKPEQKRDKQFQASVNEVFQNFRKGNMTLEDLQKEVLRISGGVDLPDWANQ